MWIEVHLASENDWLLGISRYDGYDPEYDSELSYFTIGFCLFSISFGFESK